LANVQVHDYVAGGKSRTWNRFVHHVLSGEEEAVLFMDGDAIVAPGSIDALVETLASEPNPNAAAGLPLNGRMAARYRQQLREDGGLFGDLYALSGSFVARIRARGLSLPEDLIGDDGLVAAWACTDLQTDAAWDRARVAACEGAGFFCEPVSLASPATWGMQYRRMINYSLRFFQNRIVSDIMAREGPDGLPARLSDLYPDWIGRCAPRAGAAGWFDRQALARMRRAA
ncbi:MAG TPA: glycosyltransferase family A protein, partial [Sphingobium sp.]|nr:glycosyltransferase family A protein [Sphingobium sp.]